MYSRVEEDLNTVFQAAKAYHKPAIIYFANVGTESGDEGAQAIIQLNNGKSKIP